jgi:hypothetical protein
MNGLMPIVRRPRRPLIDPNYRAVTPAVVESPAVEAPPEPVPLVTETKPDESTTTKSRPRGGAKKGEGSRSARG